MLELKAINLALRQQIMAQNFSLTIKQGEIITITGASGSGKSSLLNLIAGSLDAGFNASGDILLAGRKINILPMHQRQIGILFQDALLFPHLSVGDNLAFALPAGLNRQERTTKIIQALQDCNLQNFADSDPVSLSGGQKARIALMRTLLAQPKCLLLDEPFSKLDPELRDTFRKFVFHHLRAKQLPAILVTHDPDDAKATDGKKFNLPLLQSAP